MIEAERPLLPHIPPRQRGPVMNYFLTPVRAGVMNPAAIVKTVIAHMRADLKRRRQFYANDRLDDFRQALIAVISHPTEALALAQEAVDYHRLPDAERQRLKAERSERHRQEYMASQPPTEKQLAYLRNLGVATAPANRLDASQLIEGRVGKGGKDG
jgi:acetyl-CoA carboxylase carboxyltransferase component